MDTVVKGVEIQATGEVQAQASYHLRDAQAPGALKRLLPLFGFDTGRSGKDRVYGFADLLTSRTTSRLGRPAAAVRPTPPEVMVDKGALQSTHLMHHTALLLRLRNTADDCRRQACSPSLTTNCTRSGARPRWMRDTKSCVHDAPSSASAA